MAKLQIIDKGVKARSAGILQYDKMANAGKQRVSLGFLVVVNEKETNRYKWFFLVDWSSPIGLPPLLFVALICGDGG